MLVHYPPYAYFTLSSRQHETRMRVWMVHLSHLTHSQPVLVLPHSSWKIVGKLYASQRIRISHLLIEATLNFVCSSPTRVWMSTFVCTSSRSHLAKSLNECPRQECNTGIIVETFHPRNLILRSIVSYWTTEHVCFCKIPIWCFVYLYSASSQFDWDNHCIWTAFATESIIRQTLGILVKNNFYNSQTLQYISVGNAPTNAQQFLPNRHP